MLTKIKFSCSSLDITHKRDKRPHWGTCVWHDSFTCVTWLLQMCDVTHSYAWCDVFHSYVWQDSWMYDVYISFICVTGLMNLWRVYFIHMCDSTHECMTWLTTVWHVSRMFVNMRRDSQMLLITIALYISHAIKMCDRTYEYVTWLTNLRECVT